MQLLLLVTTDGKIKRNVCPLPFAFCEEQKEI